MKAKLLIDGKEFEVEVSWAELQRIQDMQQKKTGYERVENEKGTFYWVNGIDSKVYGSNERYNNQYYDSANYYSNKTVAENNARADKLTRQLRRFAAEYRKTDLDWAADDQNKYTIRFNYYENSFSVDFWIKYREFGGVFFDTKEAARLAIDTFHDELMWYYTEYKDSL